MEEQKDNVKTAAEVELNIKNVNNNVKFTGFGESMMFDIREQILTGENFTKEFKPDYDEDATATLHFGKSKKDIFFFNKYDLELKVDDAIIRRTFYVNQADKITNKDAQGNDKDEYINSNFTLREAVNLMHGRSVLKTFTKKDVDNPEKLIAYKAWVSIDFKNTDKHGNYKMIKKPYYNIAKTLESFPFYKNKDEQARLDLKSSLEKGNLQRVAVGEQIYFIAANPEYKTISIYDSNNIPIAHSQAKGQAEQQQQQGTVPDLSKENSANIQAGKDQNAEEENNQTRGRGARVRA